MSGRERGNAMVEFAAAAALMLPVFFGTFHFGYSYYVYNNLETSLRAAARYAATRTYDSPDETPSEEFQTAVKNMAVHGNPAGGRATVAPNLTAANVEVRMAFVNGAPARVTVDVTGYRLTGLFGNVTLNGKPRVTFPYLGRWDPI
jgi:Flp pilus assembly protein TadG